MTEQLTQLATEITEQLAAAAKHHRLSLEAFRLAGELLLRAQKELYALNGGQKGWGAWIKKNHSLPTQQQCQKYMTLAENWNLLPADHLNLTLTAALGRIRAAMNPEPSQEDAEETDGAASSPDAEATHDDSERKAPNGSGKAKTTSRLINGGGYTARLDGDTWGITGEKKNDTAVLKLPLRVEEVSVTTYLHLTQREAAALHNLLAELI